MSITHTFTLVRRFAQAHLLVLGVLLASCENNAAPSSIDVPNGHLLGDQAGSTPSMLPAGANPNEPAGYVRFAENDLASLPAGLWKRGGQAGLWSWFPVGDPDLTIGSTTGTGMVSAPTYMSTRFWKGLKGGIAPVNFGGWESANKFKSKVYVSFWIRIRGTDYENHPVGTKLGFMSYGEPASGTRNQGTFMLEGTGSQTPAKSFSIRFGQQNIVTRNLLPNVNSSKLVTAGSWHHVESVLELNAIGQANGKFKLWIDGTQTAGYDNVVYVTSANPIRFNYWKWNPTWGGMGAVRTRDDFIDIDHIYLSGLP